MSDTDTTGAEVTFTPEEQAYIDSQGADEQVTEGKGAAETETASGSEQVQQDQGQEEADKKNSMVPHAALHEQREKRKAAEKRASQLEIENARFRERFKVLEELNTKKPEEPKVVPRASEDIFGAVDHTAQSIEQLNKRLDQQEQQTREAAKHNQLVGAYRDDASRFEQTTPDFRDAYNHLLVSRVNELKALGFEDQAIRQSLEAEEIQIAQFAFQRGESPAETIYKLAQGRGYTKKPPAADVAKKEAEAKLDTIERGQAQHKSLSAVGGSQGDADMTAERLLAMPLQDFEKWCSDNPAKAKRLMGA